MLALIWSKIPSFVKWIALIILVGALGFLAGSKLMPETIVDHQTVKDEEYTRQQVALAKAQWERDSHSTSTTTTVILKPCPPTTTEPYSCKPPCATDCSKCSSQTTSTTTTTTTDTHEHGTTDSSTTTTDHGTTHETDTTHTVTKPAGSTWSGFRVSGIASLSLLGDSKLTLTPNYGVGLSKNILGSLSLGAAVYTDKTATASLSLGLNKKWSVSATAGMYFTDISAHNFRSAFYGGSLDYRLLGPVSVGVWGYSDRTAGVSASFTVP